MATHSLVKLVASLLKRFRDSLTSEYPSREKHLENFQNFWVLVIFQTLSRVEALVVSLRRSFRDSLAGGCPSHEKDFRQNFQNFVQGFLATHFGDLLAGHLSRENRVFCTNRVKSQTILKNFLVFPRITCTSFFFSASPFPKTSIVSHKTSIFFFNLHQSSRKCMGFLLFSVYFKFLALVFLDFVFMLRYENMVVEYGSFDVLMSMIYGFCWFC